MAVKEVTKKYWRKRHWEEPSGDVAIYMYADRQLPPYV